ncbi:MAG: 4Fe-4S binding protein [Chloroflexi bacterium]|nr:4Fe-4S binding protein [Chloroflexota bacterium]
MTKVRRQIITIDEEKCDGCGACVPSCAEGALQIVNGKARLVKESFCDGLGACLGECPQGALRVLDLEVDAYDETAVLSFLQETTPDRVEQHVAHLNVHGIVSSYNPAPLGVAACPSVEMRTWDDARTKARDSSQSSVVNRRSVAGGQPTAAIPLFAASEEPVAPRQRSELGQWPVQLHLLPLQAPFFHDADLYLIADCVPFAYPNLHADFLKDHAVAVGCPKLDDGRAYIAKLTQILRNNDIRSLRVVRMEVPCCGGLEYIARQALEVSGKDIPLDSVTVNIHS